MEQVLPWQQTDTLLQLLHFPVSKSPSLCFICHSLTGPVLRCQTQMSSQKLLKLLETALQLVRNWGFILFVCSSNLLRQPLSRSFFLCTICVLTENDFSSLSALAD